MLAVEAPRHAELVKRHREEPMGLPTAHGTAADATAAKRGTGTGAGPVAAPMQPPSHEAADLTIGPGSGPGEPAPAGGGPLEGPKAPAAQVPSTWAPTDAADFAAGVRYWPPLRYSVLSRTGLTLRAGCALDSAEATRVAPGTELLVVERRLEPSGVRGAGLMRLCAGGPEGAEGWTSELPRFVALATGQAAPERCTAAPAEELVRREARCFNERGEDLQRLLETDCCDCMVLRAGLDVHRLRAELEAAEQEQGFLEKTATLHATQMAASTRGWSAIPLRSIRGAEGQEGSSNTGVQEAGDFEDTATMRRHCPYISQIVAEIGAPRVLRVRLMKLRAGGVISPHRDYFADPSLVRLHVPIVTDADAEFKIRGRCQRLEAGSLYFTNVRQEHEAANRSSRDRVHLVIDVEAPLSLQDLVREA